MDSPEVFRVPEALALDMAYAEQHYRELAIIALRDTNAPFADASKKAGERAATRIALDSFGSYEDTPTQQHETFTLSADLSVSKQDIQDFMKTSCANERDATRTSGQLWNALHRIAVIEAPDGKITINPHSKKDPTDAIPLQNLLHITRYHHEESTAQPDKSPSDILGMGWGAATIDTLDVFIARELQKAQNTQANPEAYNSSKKF